MVSIISTHFPADACLDEEQWESQGQVKGHLDRGMMSCHMENLFYIYMIYYNPYSSVGLWMVICACQLL